MKNNVNNPTVYWATEESKDVVQKLQQDRQIWIDRSTSTGIFSGYVTAFWRNTMSYYSPLLDPQSWDTSLNFGGREGELIKMKIPKARTLTNQYVTLVTKQRLNYEAITDITDAQPQVTAKLAKNICKSLHEINNLDEKVARAAELTVVVGMSFICTLWRTDRGYEYTATETNVIKSGEVTFEVKDISSVMWDWTISDWEEVPYVVVRCKRNRWDLVAETQDEELKKQLIDLPCCEEEKELWSSLTYTTGTMNRDMVYIYYFIHKACPSLINGRVTIFANEHCILSDQMSNPYGGIPVEPIIFERIKDTTLGYPMYSSMMPAQEMLDHCFSVTASNQSAFGVQSMLNPRGNKLSVDQMSGMKIWHYNPQDAEGGGKPEPVQFPSTPPEVMNFESVLDRKLGDISMMNDTLRGSPPSQVTSGAMAATLSANALEFLNAAQKAVIIAIERTMNHALVATKNYATVDQIVDIVGENNFAYVKQFKADSLKGLRKIKIRTQSPLMNSIAGRIQLGESLMDRGLIKDPMLLIQLQEGAAPETLFKSTWTENIAVQAELDALMEGRPVFPLETDNHPLYIAAYKEIMDNPIIRERTELPQVIIPLMKERLQMELSMDPMLKAILRGQPLPAEQPAPQLPAGKDAPPMGGAPGTDGPQPAAPAQPIPVQ